MNISILIPSRNGLEFLQWSYNSIRKSQGNHDVEILILDDFSDKDDTWQWLESLSDNNLKIFRNEGPDRWGISGGYKFLANKATQEVICHWHNDMFMTEGTLDEIEKVLFERIPSYERCELYETGEYTRGIKMGGAWIHWKSDKRNKFDNELIHIWLDRWAYGVPKFKNKNKKNVVCLTRIEPPIYNEGPEKIIWKDGPIELTDWDEIKFLNYLPKIKEIWNNKTTSGHFAPFFMFREEYLKLGGNDTETFPLQSREDSDWAFRLVLAGFKTIQIPHFTYHFASRGNRRSKHETDPFTDNPKWINHNIKATRNFIRKWQTMNLHDEYLKPNKPNKYNIGIIVTNASTNLLYNLEIWCDHIQVDLEKEIIDRYIEFEQPNTKFNLRSRINSKHLGKIPDILIQVDGFRFTQDDMNVIYNISDILTDSGEENTEMEIGNLKLNIGKMNHYEKDLIVCRN